MSVGLRISLSVITVIVGAGLGLILTMLLLGAPHAFPGLLMNAPEPLRALGALVGVVLIVGVPATGLYLLWR